MTKAECDRGAKEHRQQLHALREKWPLAFPVQPEDVRPLALGIADQIAEAMGWSVQYTLGVLRPWKMAPFYCRAVLSHDRRITLDGTPAETLDAGAKELAAKVLARRPLPSRPPSRSPCGPQLAQPGDDPGAGSGAVVSTMREKAHDDRSWGSGNSNGNRQCPPRTR